MSQLSSKRKVLLWVLKGVLVTSVILTPALTYHTFCLGRLLFKIKGLLILPAQGKSLDIIQENWKKAMRAGQLSHVVVATANKKVAEGCRRFGADVMMTSESCRNGMERCMYALPGLKKKYNVVIHVEGDGLINPQIINDIIVVHQELPDFKGVMCMDLKMLASGGHEIKAIRVDNYAQNKSSTFLDRGLVVI